MTIDILMVGSGQIQGIGIMHVFYVLQVVAEDTDKDNQICIIDPCCAIDPSKTVYSFVLWIQSV
jgi:hypothetical protein